MRSYLFIINGHHLLTTTVRLLGIFIWGIDLDNKNHDALNAVLQPDGIGKFRQRNGVGSNTGLSTYVGAIGDSCIIEGKGFDSAMFQRCLPLLFQIVMSPVSVGMDTYRFVFSQLRWFGLDEPFQMELLHLGLFS